MGTIRLFRGSEAAILGAAPWMTCKEQPLADTPWNMTKEAFPRLIPTGTCWCGCGTQTGIGSFFAPGHDKIAEAALMAAQYDSSVPQLLHAHGFGPGRSVIAAAVEVGAWSKCEACWYRGTPASLATHRRKTLH